MLYLNHRGQVGHLGRGASFLSKQHGQGFVLAGETPSYLVDGGAHGALEEHLQHLGVGLFPVRGHGQFPGLLLHVLDGHLDGRQVKLRER